MITNIILFTIITFSILYCWIDAMRNKTTKTYKRDMKGRFTKYLKKTEWINDIRVNNGLSRYGGGENI